MFTKRAFTLAEVLITIMIIGMIAVITLPSLIHHIEDQIQISQAKAAYSILDRAIKMAIAENGTIDQWDMPIVGGGKGYSFGQIIKPYLQVAEDCSQNSYGSCFNYEYNSDGSTCTGSKTLFCNTSFLNVNGSVSHSVWNPHQHSMRFKLNNNIRIYNHSFNYDNQYSLTRWDVDNAKDQFYNTVIIVDANGEQGPNKVGYDVWKFGVTKTGLTPKACEFWATRKKTGCSIEDNNTWSGCSCYWWIINKNNMNYKYKKPADSEWE